MDAQNTLLAVLASISWQQASLPALCILVGCGIGHVDTGISVSTLQQVTPTFPAMHVSQKSS